jgi:beta-glucosidase
MMQLPVNNLKYSEGVFVGYRWYESKNIKPLYPFGFGLSYTTYTYKNFKVSKSNFKKGDEVLVEFEIENTGKMAGSEIAQLYINDEESSVSRPVKELKRFKKVTLKAGEVQKIQFVLTEQDFAFWDINTKNWKTEPGAFTIMIGAASNDIKLQEKVTLN